MNSDFFLDFNHLVASNLFAHISANHDLKSRNSFITGLGYDDNQLAVPEQTHSTNILYVNSSGTFKNCDGLITHNSHLILSLQTADCIPIFIYDIITGLRGLVHAGWRGITNGIIDNTMNFFLKEESSIKNIHVLLGPAICNKCFEVGPEVASLFDKSCVSDGLRKNYFVDLHAQVKLELLQYYIFEENINISKVCTYENQDCCSYRRDGSNAGRMYSFFGGRK